MKLEMRGFKQTNEKKQSTVVSVERVVLDPLLSILWSSGLVSSSMMQIKKQRQLFGTDRLALLMQF